MGGRGRLKTGVQRLVASELVFLGAGLGLGFGILLVAGIALVVLEDRRRGEEPQAVVPRAAARALLLAAPLRPGHPWSGQPDSAGDPGEPAYLSERPSTERAFRVITGQGPATGTETAADRADACATAREAAVEACAHADRLKAVSLTARERHVEAQRAYDQHVAVRDAAAAAIDPRAVRAAKDEAQARFHQAHHAAGDRPGRDRAATRWLQEISEINVRSRDAAAVVAREAALTTGLFRDVERAALEADGARVNAERAMEACHAARAALAACDEHQRAFEPHPGESGPAMPGDSVMLRLLRGDSAAMADVVGRLTTDDAERRRWQIMLSDLVDAIVARAIDAVSFEFPERHRFWSALEPVARRDVAGALAALGYRFDGLGGFVDGRIPSQRDLSLAVGQAGLDPGRVRPWPADADLPLLYRNVKVDAAAYLEEVAGGLTMGEMVDLLGRRAEPLGELWMSWGRVRPLLAGA